MPKKPSPPKPKDNSRLPWITPGTPSTWLCRKNHVNPRSTTTCGSCR